MYFIYLFVYCSLEDIRNGVWIQAHATRRALGVRRNVGKLRMIVRTMLIEINQGYIIQGKEGYGGIFRVVAGFQAESSF